MGLARFLDFKPKFDQRLQQLTGQPYVLAVAGSSSDSTHQREEKAGEDTAGVEGSEAASWSVAGNKNGTDEEKPAFNWLNAKATSINTATTTTPKPSSRNGLLGSESIRHKRRSSSAEIDENDDDVATLWRVMMKLRNYREKDLFKDLEQQLTEVELKQVFQKKNAEATALLKLTSKDVQDKWKTWYSHELDTAKFINKQRNQTANKVVAMLKNRFGSLSGKLELGWRESGQSGSDILRDMPDDPLELTLMKGYGEESERHYRKLKERSVAYLREYKSKMTSFMDNKLCIDQGDFDAAETETKAALEAPPKDMMEQLKGLVQEIRIPLTRKVESNRAAETVSFQKAIDYAFEKYKEILKEKMEQDELAGNSGCNTAKARMAEWDKMQKMVYKIVSVGFETTPGFHYTSLWKWPDEEPETFKQYNTEERDKYIMCRFNGQQGDQQQPASSASNGVNQSRHRSEANRNHQSCESGTRRRHHSSGSESSNGLERKRSRTDVNFATPDQLRGFSIPTSALSSARLGPSPARLPATTNYFVGIHFGCRSTIVQIFSPGGVPTAFFEFEDILALDRNNSMEPIVNFNSTKRRTLLKLIPSKLLVNHDQISTAEWETSTKRLYFQQEGTSTQEPLHAEEILALHLQQVVNRIEKFGLNPLKAEKVVVSIPAMSNPACRRRLKSALDLVGWSNSVLVHTSTAVALSCLSYRSKLPSKYHMVTVHLGSGLAEIAVFEVSGGDAYTMLGVESSRMIRYAGTYKKDSAISETVALTEKLLKNCQISRKEVRLCSLVVETPPKIKAHSLVQGLEAGLKKSGFHCLFAKGPPKQGILRGLGSVVQAQRSGNRLYGEIFPWNIDDSTVMDTTIRCASSIQEKKQDWSQSHWKLLLLDGFRWSFKVQIATA